MLDVQPDQNYFMTYHWQPNLTNTILAITWSWKGQVISHLSDCCACSVMHQSFYRYTLNFLWTMWFLQRHLLKISLNFLALLLRSCLQSCAACTQGGAKGVGHNFQVAHFVTGSLFRILPGACFCCQKIVKYQFYHSRSTYFIACSNSFQYLDWPQWAGERWQGNTMKASLKPFTSLTWQFNCHFQAQLVAVKKAFVALET